MSTAALSSAWFQRLGRTRRTPAPAPRGAKRPGATATAPPPQVLRWSWPLAAGAAIAVAVALVLVFVRLQVVRTGYDLSTARDLVQQLEHERRELRLEIATITSPRRLEARARQLGLQPPERGQVVREP
jgi:cell division protein FtsL